MGARIEVGGGGVSRAVRTHFDRLSRRKGTDEDGLGFVEGRKSDKRHY